MSGLPEKEKQQTSEEKSQPVVSEEKALEQIRLINSSDELLDVNKPVENICDAVTPVTKTTDDVKLATSESAAKSPEDQPVASDSKSQNKAESSSKESAETTDDTVDKDVSFYHVEHFFSLYHA
jgi:hypothetical protein